MAALPAELRSHVVANDSFDPGEVIILVVDGTNLDIEIQVLAPDMHPDDFTALHATIMERLRLALSRDDGMFTGVVSNRQANGMTVIMGNQQHPRSAPAADIVRRMACAITEATEHAAHRRVFTLREWQCLVLVDWNEPFSTAGHSYVLTIPSGVGLTTAASRERLTERAGTMLDRSLGTYTFARKDGATELTLRSALSQQISPVTAVEQIRRLVFVIGTVLRLQGVNHLPVVELARPFDPYVDDDLP